jgi:hypothetical protein
MDGPLEKKEKKVCLEISRDVKPVVHQRWKRYQINGRIIKKCEACALVTV